MYILVKPIRVFYLYIARNFYHWIQNRTSRMGAFLGAGPRGVLCPNAGCYKLGAQCRSISRASFNRGRKVI